MQAAHFYPSKLGLSGGHSIQTLELRSKTIPAGQYLHSLSL